jgi:hypothetical protein
VIIILSQIGCSSVRETGAGDTPNAKLAILMAASSTAVISAQWVVSLWAWKDTALVVIRGIHGVSLRDLRMVTTLILVVLTTSLRGLRSSATLRPWGLTTLILMLLILLKSARLVLVGDQAPIVLPPLKRCQ